jgi:hypothetical protein
METTRPFTPVGTGVGTASGAEVIVAMVPFLHQGKKNGVKPLSGSRHNVTLMRMSITRVPLVTQIKNRVPIVFACKPAGPVAGRGLISSLATTGVI